MSSVEQLSGKRYNRRAMTLIYAALSALTYGAADFLCGLSARRNSALTVVAWSQSLGFLLALIAAPLLGAAAAAPADLVWGAAAGICGAAGVGLLYRGLATGLASIVSPVAALTGTALPVLFGVLVRGERPPVLTWTGVFLALPAILLLSSEKEEHRHHVLPSLRIGFLAGVSFSGFFILIAQTGEGSGMWPLVAARCVTVPLFFLLTFFRANSLRLKKGSRLQAMAGGVLDMGANVFYLLSTRSGILVTAVILTSLYPAPTVILQRVFVKERLNIPRIAGLILAIVGAALIGIGG